MKNLVILVLLSVLCSDLLSQAPNSVIDVQAYAFNIELSDDNDTIKCVATVQVKFLKSTGQFTLDLISQKADGKGMKVVSVRQGNQSLSFTHANDIVGINLVSPARVNEEIMVLVTYRGIPADGLIISKNKYNRRTFFSDNWPNRARHWLACVDHPSDKAAVEFIVTAPSHYQVVSNGLQIEETNVDSRRTLTHYKETVPLAMKITVVGVAEFAVNYAGDVQNIPVYSWVYPEDKRNGFYDYSQATEILPFFIQHVGPYPYKKLANVQSKTIFGGMENAGTIFYSENSVTGKRGIEGLIAHEIAHQWFGNMATETEWAHVWLSEGFATYMAILYMENKYGADTARKMLLQDREQVIEFSKQRAAPIVDSVTKNYMELLNPNSYQKASWVLHMLRRQLGDSLFWKGVRTYYARYAGKNASTDDLRKVMEEISGKDLSQFFKQWLFTSGHPKLKIDWNYDVAKKLLTLNISQQQTPLFQFPMELRMIGSGEDGTITKSSFIKDKQTTIAIPMSAKPQRVIVDPNVNLLHERDVMEKNQ